MASSDAPPTGGTDAGAVGGGLMTDLRRLVEDGIDSGLHLGMQVYASVGGRPVVDAAFGRATTVEPMTTDTVVPWISAGKPLVAVAFGQLFEAGDLGPDDAVAEHLPEFQGPGREGVTVRHLLTHTVGFARDLTAFEASYAWEDALRLACELPLVADGRAPGSHAGYSTFAAWHLLGEILARVDGEPFAASLSRRVLGPMALGDTAFGLPRGDAARAEMWDVSGRRPRPAPLVNTNAFWRAAIPGAGARGPVRDLGRFYEVLLGVAPTGSAGVSTATIEWLTRAARPRLFDAFYGGALTWGLGFITDRRMLAGNRTAEGTFGHDGYRCAMGFAEPRRGLVFAAVANGLPSATVHRRRLRALTDRLLAELDGRAG